MSIELLTGMLGWAAVLNYTVLSLWVLILVLAHDWVYAQHHRWFKVSVETFDATHYAAIVFYKLGVFMFLLGPYIVLKIIH